MFVLAAAMFTWRSRWLIVVGSAAAVGGWSVRLWRYGRERDGLSTKWLTEPDDRAPSRDHLFGVFVNGTHPLLPWLALFCAGMVLGRVLRTTWWRPAAIGAGIGLVGFGWLVSSQTRRRAYENVALSMNPLDRGVVYTASALGTALVVYATVDWVAERGTRAATDPLRRAGQMTLSLYIAHVLVFNLVVDWLGWIEPAGVDVGAGVRAGLLARRDRCRRCVATAVRHRAPPKRIYRTIGG